MSFPDMDSWPSPQKTSQRKGKVPALSGVKRSFIDDALVALRPCAGDAPQAEPVALSRQGYSILHWSRGGMRYWAVADVADVAPAQLATLAAALQTP